MHKNILKKLVTSVLAEVKGQGEWQVVEDTQNKFLRKLSLEMKRGAFNISWSVHKNTYGGKQQIL
jgi:hypothetical protein